MTAVRPPAVVDVYPIAARFDHRSGRQCPCSPRAGTVMQSGATCWVHREPPADLRGPVSLRAGRGRDLPGDAA
jgi:hypothetical protein